MWRSHFSGLCAVLVCLIAVGAPWLWAQEAGTGTASGNTLAGTIAGESGAVPAGKVTVHAFHAASETNFPTGVNPTSGRFLLAGLPEGTYQLWIETPEGLFPAADAVSLSGGLRRQVSCTLSPGRLPMAPPDRSPPSGLPDAPIAGFTRLDFVAAGVGVRTGAGKRILLTLFAVAAGYGLYEIIDDDDVSPSGP